MGQAAARVLPPAIEEPLKVLPVPTRPEPVFNFHSLVLSEPTSLAKGRGLTLAVSMGLHAILLAATVLVPILFFEDILPAPDKVVRAFFVAAPEVAPPPPPPPPPPAAGVRPKVKAPAVPRPEIESRFVAPVQIPERVVPDEGIDLGVEGGVPGGVEGGVPGGVVGGVVGGLPTAAPPPAPAVVRIGGNIKAPKLVHSVQPVYPQVALHARLSGFVIVEAQVGVDGRVQSVRVVQSAALFDEAAVEAVKQWRYVPLLLNGAPTPFILTVTVQFNLLAPGGRS
jgi:periplasmic protein TonB